MRHHLVIDTGSVPSSIELRRKILRSRTRRETGCRTSTQYSTACQIKMQ